MKQKKSPIFGSNKSERFMKCPRCKSVLRKVLVDVAGAKTKAVSYQCAKCYSYYEFEPLSAAKVVGELRDAPLKIKQRVVKLSGDRLGIYFNSHIVRSLDIRRGGEILVSVPDKKHILIELGLN